MAIILVIDDEAIVRETLVNMLKEMGHDLISAGSYSEGVELVEKEKWDLALVDICLGDEDSSGLDILGIARNSAPDCPVIIVTGPSDSRLSQKGS